MEPPRRGPHARTIASGPGCSRCPLRLALGLLAIVPAAAVNAWARLAAPWRTAPVYVRRVETMPGRLVVPHGEPFTIAVKLRPGSAWTPPGESPSSASKAPVEARLENGRLLLHVAGTDRAGLVEIQIGDRARPPDRADTPGRVDLGRGRRHAARVPRPPAARTEGRARRSDLAGQGSLARFAATASRTLAIRARSTAAEDAVRRDGPRAPRALVAGPLTIEFRWRDTFGLDGQGAVHAGDRRPRRRAAVVWCARTCPGRRSCSIQQYV